MHYKKSKPTCQSWRELCTEHYSNVLEIAEACNVHVSTVYTWINSSAKFKKFYEEGKQRLLKTAEGSIKKKILDGNLSATIFYLKCHGKSEGWIEKHQLDNVLTGNVSITVKRKTVGKDTDAES